MKIYFLLMLLFTLSEVCVCVPADLDLAVASEDKNAGREDASEESYWLTRVAAVAQMTDPLILKKWTLHDPNLCVRLAAAARLYVQLTPAENVSAYSPADLKTGMAILQFRESFSNLPPEHSARLVGALVPALQVLNDRDVVNLLGEIVSIEASWAAISTSYGMTAQQVHAGTLDGEEFTFSIKLKEFGSPLSFTWRTRFPQYKSISYNKEPLRVASIKAGNILGPALEQLPETILQRIATENKDPSVRYAAVEKIKNQSLLAKFIVETKDHVVRDASLERLNDSQLLADPAVQSVLNKVAMTKSYGPGPDRRRIIEKVTDQTVIAEIAMHDRDQGIRRFAVERLSDPELLVKIALETKKSMFGMDEDRLLEATVEAAVAKISDETALARIAKQSPFWPGGRSAVAKITSEKLLVTIAQKAAFSEVRLVAVEKLTDHAVLSHIVLNDESVSVRDAARKRLQTIKAAEQ